jgi:hypothetical protein
LLRLLKMLELKSKCRGRVVLEKLVQQVDALLEPALDAWVATQPLSPELARALGVEAKVDSALAQPAVAAAELEGVEFDTWRRIPLLPGLELMLRSDVSRAVKDIARRLHLDVVGTTKR